MIQLKVPDWWDSVRALLALMLTATYCVGIFNKIPDAQISGLKELTLLALTFYFALKKRPDEGGIK